MADEPTRERTVVVHTARSSMEAMVIRGLLESNGIASPASIEGDPLPFPTPSLDAAGASIVVLESQAEQARHLIHDYLDDSEIISSEGSPEESQS